MSGITRIQDFDGWWAKRDDEANKIHSEYPSGSKVRQYARMGAVNPKVPMVVGCSAHSAMQVYVAAAAKVAGVKAIIHVPARAKRTEATEYAISLGAKVIEERPAYLNVIQSRARDSAAKLKKGYVRWDEDGAVVDAARQINELPRGVKRIVIPTGSGLTAAGVLAGLHYSTLNIPVFCVAVSGMAEGDHIKKLARHAIDTITSDGRGLNHKLSSLKVVRAKSKYDVWEAAVLPDGSPLDPYYAAKALPFVRKGDLLWVPGIRPLSAMPERCVTKIRELQARG